MAVTGKDLLEKLNGKKKDKKEEEKEKKSASSGTDLLEKLNTHQTTNVDGVDQAYIDAFIKDADNFFSTIEDDYSNLGWSNASSVYSAKRSSWDELDSRASSIQAWLYRNRKSLDSATYNGLYSAIGGYRSNASSVLDAFKSAMDTYAQFDTEEAYKAYIADRYPVDTSSPDFNDLGSSGWSKYLEDVSKTETKTPAWQEAIIRGFTTSSDNPVNMAFNNVVYDYRNDDSYRRPQDDWSEEQKYTFGILWNTDKAKAYQYAEITNADKAKAKEAEALKKIAEASASGFWPGVGNTIGAIASAPFGLADFLNDLAMKSAGRPITSDGAVTPFEYSQAVTGGITNRLNEMSGTLNENIPIIGGKGLGDVYGLGTSIAQSMASAYTLGPSGTLISYFGQGAASGVDDALSRGATEGEAVLYGISLGAFEGIAESIGIDNLFKLGSTATVKGFLKNILKQAGAEGMEEGLTSLLSNIADNVIMNGKSNFDALVKQYMQQGMSESEAKKKAWMDSVEGIAFDTIAGAASGGVSGGIHTTAQNIVANKDAKKTYGDGAGLVSEALGVSSEGSELRTLAEEYQKKLDGGKNLSGSQLRTLDEAIASNDKDLIKKTVLRRLGELGETTDVTPVAETLVKYAMGEKLGSKDMAILNNSDKGHIVLAELNRENIQSGGLASKWSQNIGTRRINPESYNKDLYDLAKAVAGFKEAVEKESVTKTATEEENATATKFEASEGGETIVTNTGEKVSVKGVASIKGGTLMLELDNGKVVNAKDVSFGSTDDALVYEMVTDMEVSPKTADALIKGFKAADGVSAEAYKAYIPLAYKYGMMNYEAGLDNLDLTAEQKNTAFVLGRDEAKTLGRTWSNTSRKANDTTTAKASEDGIIYEGFELNEDSSPIFRRPLSQVSERLQRCPLLRFISMRVSSKTERDMLPSTARREKPPTDTSEMVTESTSTSTQEAVRRERCSTRCRTKSFTTLPKIVTRISRLSPIFSLKTTARMAFLLILSSTERLPS